LFQLPPIKTSLPLLATTTNWKIDVDGLEGIVVKIFDFTCLNRILMGRIQNFVVNIYALLFLGIFGSANGW
jgi:hypothetical protein